MVNRKHLLLLSVITVSLLASNAFAESLIRISCIGEAEGAKVFINGEFADNCPANLFVEPGRKQIRVVKSVSEDYERVFETERVLRADSPKRVNVELSQPRLTAEAKRARADKTLSEARGGDIEAMRRMASFYREGNGVEKNPEKAEEWDNKARTAELASEADAVRQRAERGNVDAMRELALFYENGRGVDRDTNEAARWRRKADESDADLTLIRAKSGEVEAMKAMSELYAEGKGVEQDQGKSEEWASRAEDITQARLDEKQAIERRQQARERLNNLDFLWWSKRSLETVQADNPNDPAEVFSMMTVSPFFTVTGVMNDLISAPTKTAELVRLRKALAARPSSFENPESIIAKAYRSQNP